MRVFLDTNVFASAFGSRGLCADVLREVLVVHELIVGEVVLEELERVLGRAFGLSGGKVKGIVKFLREFEVVARPEEPSNIVLRDPDDRWILASAIVGRADVLVTGDDDLLAASDTVPIRIVNPRGLWKLLRQPR